MQFDHITSDTSQGEWSDPCRAVASRPVWHPVFGFVVEFVGKGNQRVRQQGRQSEGGGPGKNDMTWCVRFAMLLFRTPGLSATQALAFLTILEYMSRNRQLVRDPN